MSVAATASRTIAELSERISAGDADAENAFWDATMRRGTPLIEAIDGDPHHSTVTFLWRGDGGTTSVLFFSAITDEPIVALEHITNTSVWYTSCRVANDVRSGYQFAENVDLPDDAAKRFVVLERLGQTGGIVPDPFNARRVDFGVPEAAAISTLEMPRAPDQPWAVRDPDCSAGRIETHRFESRLLGNQRVIWTYLPPGYNADGNPYPLLVLYDGFGYLKIDVPATLDNLIAKRKIPPIVVAFVHQLDRMEELTGNEQFAECIASELVGSWLPSRYHVRPDASSTAIGGMSAGGYGALFAAFRYPTVFENVLSQSGSFWWGPGASLPVDVRSDRVEWNWLTKQVESSPTLPRRFYADVGELEVPRRPGQPDMVAANRRMRDVLTAKGCDVRYQEFAGGHDYACWRGTVADGLVWLFGERARES